MEKNNLFELCVLDCSSIQKYVFGSNKLKTNIGASEIVECIYQELIPKILAEMSDKKSWRIDEWKDNDWQLKIANDPNRFAEIGYIGGGNALLIFRDAGQDNAQKFIKKWSTELLTYAPGVVPAIAIIDGVEIKNGDIAKEDIDNVFSKLARNKNTCIPETVIERHGITAECKLSGLSVESYENKYEKDWLSSVAKTKYNYYDKAFKKLNQQYEHILSNKYIFGYDLEKLGQKEGEESHIGIVHIDGNSLGEAFKNCKGLIERRELSLQVDKATKQAIEITLRQLITKIKAPQCLDDILNLKEENGKKVLPLRPIILNGDDITLICDARISFFLAETFMQAFASQPVDTKDKDGNKMKLSSCAGIAIIRTKYPFYRGYRLAEELCKSAKELGRKENQSWLDFHIAYSGLSGNLEDIRERQYKMDKASLLWRPWKIVDGQDQNSFKQLKNGIKHFLGQKNFAIHKDKTNEAKKKWPNSKLHQLARALTAGKVETEEFIKFAQAKGLFLPAIAKRLELQKTGWITVKREGVTQEITPYFDILEVMDFYPQCLLD